MTATSIACGVLACLVVVDVPLPPSRLALAATLVVVAGLLDAADGSVARILDLRSRFGELLDTLADAISFGVAPAIVAYAGALRDLGAVGLVVAVGFALSTMLRLARFHDPPGPWRWPARSRGLPSTMAGGATASLLSCGSQLAEPLSGTVVATAMSGLAILMLSDLPFATFKDLAHRRGSLVHFGGIVSLATVAGLLGGGAWFFGVGAAAYLGTGLVDAMITAIRRR